MKSALTRLTILFGASLMLCVSSGAGVALAAKTKPQPTNPAQNQYIEQVPPTISGKKHTHGATKRHKSAGTKTGSSTSTGASNTPSKHVHKDRTATVKHHKTKSRKTKRHEIKKPGKSKSATSRKARDLSSKRSHDATGLTAADATGSSGGISVWLLVILALVLVGGSTAGILRYRRNH